MKSEIQILRSGIYSTLQRAADFSQIHFGVSPGGPMDQNAASLANFLVGNPEDSPVLECTLDGPVLKFEETLKIAVTGAKCSVLVNDAEFEMNQCIEVPEGSILKVGRSQNGFRSYIGISGDLSTENENNEPASRGELRKGEKIYSAQGENAAVISLQKPKPIVYDQRIEVFTGPEFSILSENDLKLIFDKPIKVLSESGRKAYLLEKTAVKTKAGEMISSGVIPGTIQLTPEGTMIILMRDCQTIGGYPRIGVVTSGGMNRLAQVRPGEEVVLFLSSGQ